MNKLLIVDDIVTNRKLLSQLLATIGGFEIIEACDGDQAITVYEKTRPDLILMDVNMPKMNGYEAASIIKSRCGKQYVPIIFITALSSEASLTQSLDSGGDDFISKPFSVEVLESKIKVHLRIRELNLQLNEKNETLYRVNQKLSHDRKLIDHFFENALKQSFLDKDVIQYHMSSLSLFNGDIFLVERGPKGGLYIVMGDFTGHGLTAAMGTLPVALIFFKMAQAGAKIEDFASELNHQLHKLMPPSMFFAATLLKLNSRGDTVTVWMGGVPEIYCIDKFGQLKEKIHSQHMPLGIVEDNNFNATTQMFSVETDDKIYLYSDGIIEAKNKSGEQFGDERLEKILSGHDKNVFNKTLQTLNEFTGNNQNDDVTFVELTCQPIFFIENGINTLMSKSVLPWELSISLSVEEIKSTDAIKKLSSMLGKMPYLNKHKETLHVLLSEIFSNSVEHSILNIKSTMKIDGDNFSKYYKNRNNALSNLETASINFKFNFYFENDHPYLKIQVNDSGCGYKTKKSEYSEDLLYGRGLAIMKNLCENVSFSESGQLLTVLYKF